MNLLCNASVIVFREVFCHSPSTHILFFKYDVVQLQVFVLVKMTKTTNDRVDIYIDNGSNNNNDIANSDSDNYVKEIHNNSNQDANNSNNHDSNSSNLDENKKNYRTATRTKTTTTATTTTVTMTTTITTSTRKQQQRLRAESRWREAYLLGLSKEIWGIGLERMKLGKKTLTSTEHWRGQDDPQRNC